MADITLNSSVRANLRTLQNTAELMNRTQERVSSGKEVNSALDNPSNFFTAQSLERRAGDLNSLLDSVSNSVKTLEAADNGLSSITDVVEQLKATARQALQSPSAVTERASVTGTLTGLTNDKLSAVSGGTVVKATATGDLAFASNDVVATATGGTVAGLDDTDLLNSATVGTIAAGESITVNGTSIEFVASGATGNQLNVTDNVGQLRAKIASVLGTGSTVTIGAGPNLVLTAGDTRQNIQIGGASATLTKLGLTGGTFEATNASPGFAALNGKSLTFQTGTNPVSTITFGTANGQVNTVAEFEDAIAAAGGELTRTAGNFFEIKTNAANANQSFTLGGTAVAGASPASTAGTIGLRAGTVNTTTTGGTSLAGQQLTVTIPSTAPGGTGRSSTFTIGSGAGQINSIDALNNKLKADGIDVEASIDGSGRIKFQTTNDNAQGKFVISGAGSVTGFGATVAATGAASSNPVASGAGKDARDKFASDYNDLLTQINSLARDASYNGVNLLNGDDLSVIFNEDGSSKLDVVGVEFDYEGLGLDVITSENFYDADSIQVVLDRIDSTFARLESQSSKFGSQLGIVETRESFTNAMADTLEEGAYNLTAADTNVEAANLASLQTRSSLIISALSISNQQEGAILQLLR